MPRLKLLLPRQTHSWTKTPNLVLDKLLPDLKDTELRILLVLIRATSGWNREGAALILSYRTLQTRTGRGSEAVSRALASLKAKRLIHTPTAQRKYAPAKPKQDLPKSEAQQYKEKE